MNTLVKTGWEKTGSVKQNKTHDGETFKINRKQLNWNPTTETCLRVVVLLAGGVRCSCEKGNFHPRHQRVVDGHVGETQPVWRPPVGDLGLQDLLCETGQAHLKWSFILVYFYFLACLLFPVFLCFFYVCLVVILHWSPVGTQCCSPVHWALYMERMTINSTVSSSMTLGFPP